MGGFDEDFKVACNDVDLCLKIRSLNKWIVEDVFSVWYHYESKSRGLEDTPENKRFQSEIARFKRNGQKYKNGDPFHNPNFDLLHILAFKKNHKNMIKYKSLFN